MDAESTFTIVGNLARQFRPLAEDSCIEQKALAVAKADLANCGFDARIDRGGIWRVTAAETGAPETDSAGIALRFCLHPVDCVG